MPNLFYKKTFQNNFRNKHSKIIFNYDDKLIKYKDTIFVK